jgi:hypothetical protein
MGRVLGLRKVCAALLVVAAAAGTAGAQDRAVELVTTGPADTGSLTEFDGVAISEDGTTVAFSTAERLVTADEDEQRDVYVRRGGTTTIASQAQKNGNLGVQTSGPVVSQDGSRVYFTTVEQLVSEDTDATRDVYEWQDGTTRLISGRAEGAPGPDADVTVSTGRLPPPTGDRVILETTEKLLPGDGDTANDLYERTANGLRLLTGPADTDVVALDANRALTHIFFETTKDLLESDTDGGKPDTYRVTGDQFAHVSRGHAPDSANGRTWTDIVSPDGGRALLLTAEALDAGDTDEGATDVYLWQAGGPVLWLSKASGGAGCGAPPCQANTYGGSADLGRVAFTTPERLVADDTDDAIDLYTWTAGGGIERASQGPSGGNAAAAVTESIGGRTGKMSSDGRGVVFTTSEALVDEDSDAQVDLYERIDGSTRLVSTGEIGGNGGLPAGAGTYRAGSSRVLFGSATAFSRSDTDEQLDLYLREEGTTRLLSVGRAAYDADYIGASTDGARIFFRTREQLAAGDTDGGRDLYLSRQLPGAPPASGSPAADTQAPELALRLTRTTFRASNRKASISARRRTPLGTFLDVYANEAGQVNMTFSRLETGRRSKGKCVATRRRVPKSLRCTRQASQPGKLEFKISGGRNRIRFYGRVGSRRFKAGRYAVFGRAYDAAGNRSKIASATFTVRSR